MSRRSPRTHARLYRIWAICNPVGWNMTAAEIADRMGDLNPAQVGWLLRVAGWAGRVRTPQSENGASFDPFSRDTHHATDALVSKVVSGQESVSIVN